MIVHSLELENFGRFAEPRRITLAPGDVNLLAGPNGSGKSTLLAALGAAFMAHHASKADDVRRYRPWGRSVAPRVSIEFTHHGQRYRLSKSWLLKSRMALLERFDANGPTVIAQDEAAEDALPEFLGGTQSGGAGARSRQWLLAGVLWSRQNGLADIQVDGPVRETVRAIFGAQARSGTVAIVLREAARLHDEDWTPRTGKLKLHSQAGILAEQAAGLRQKVDGLEKDLTGLEMLRESAARLAAEIGRLGHAIEIESRRVAELDEAWNARQKLLDAEKDAVGRQALLDSEYKRNQALLEGRAELAQRLSRLEGQRADLCRRIGAARDDASRAAGALKSAVQRTAGTAAELEAQLAAIHAPSPAVLDHLRRLHVQLAELRARLAGALLHVEIDAESAARIEVLRGENTGPLDVRPGEPASVSGSPEIVLRLPGFGRLRVSGPAESAAELKRLIALREDERAALVKPFGDAPLEQLIARRADADRLEREFEEVRREAAAHNAGKSAEAVETASAERALADLDVQLRRTQSDIDAATAERQRLESEPLDEQQLRARQNELALTLHGLREQLAQLSNQLASDPPDLEARRGEARTALDSMQKKLGEAQQMLSSVEGGLSEEQRRAPYSSLAEARAELAAKEEEWRAARLRADAHRLLFETLQAVLQDAESHIVPELEERTAAILERIAAGIPGPVRLDPATWTPGAVCPASLRTDVALDRISGGEQEQVYFAARLALADILTQDEPHLAVFDDALLATDGARMERIAGLIEERCSRMQFLVLTCHPERYAALRGASVIRLDSKGAAR